MAAADDRTVRARMDCLGEAIDFVASFCADRGVSESDGLRMALVVEELFTNTVVHGHGGGSDAPVRFRLRVDASHLELSYEDSAPPFDPLDHLARAPVDATASAADRPVGQLGIPLIVNMAERISYAREDGCNRTRLALRRHAAVNTPGGPA
jgi:serine/threonine-protein kinase RsbW